MGFWILTLISGLLAGWLAHHKDGNPGYGFAWGFILPITGVLLVALYHYAYKPYALRSLVNHSDVPPRPDE